MDKQRARHGVVVQRGDVMWSVCAGAGSRGAPPADKREMERFPL